MSLESTALSKERIDTNGRIERLKERIYSAEPYLNIDRALIVTEAYQETEVAPVVVRRAKVLAKILERIPIYFFPGELFKFKRGF